MPKKSSNLTRQGLRDLGGNSQRPKKKEPVVIDCEHKNMTGVASGHLLCLDCGLTFDEAFDGN